MINKNISIWRGSATPPTNYHLWEKEDGGLYVYLDEKWQHLVTPADKTILDKHQKQLDKIKNLALTEIDPIDTNTYKSYQLKSDDNIFGTTINIPKDRFIKQVTLGYDNATIDESTGIITIGTGLSKEYLLFSVALQSGNYELVSINLTNFLTEKDYSNGLEVVDNKLKVKVDPSSEEYLKVSNNGIKVEGINTNFNKVNERLTTISNTQIKRSEMGVANGIATLDNNGTIPYNQLPAIADDEDLIGVNNRLKLKDRVYDPDNFSGKGYVILRKNIINGKNILTQDMINEPNTVYEIRYDFDLNNEEINIKDRCVLNFVGGSFKNGILNNICEISGVGCIDINLKYSGEFGDINSPVKMYKTCFDYNIRYMELYYASKYNVPIVLDFKNNTPSRFGASGDLVSDDSNSLQALLDTSSYYGGDADLTSVSNANAKGYLIGKPIVIKSSNNPDYDYRQRPLINKIYSDYSNEYSGKGCYIKAVNLNENEGAINLKAFGNGWPNCTNINNLYIDSTDETNHHNSFALLFEDGLLNRFHKCMFNGRNGVLNICGIDPISYSKIGVLWEQCIFESSNQDYGFAYSDGKMFGAGRSSGDNVLFINCEFGATTEIYVNNVKFINCMWSIKIGRPKAIPNTLGYSLGKEFGEFDFSTNLLIEPCTHCVLEQCYFEDFNTAVFINYNKGIPFGGEVTINNCYINGRTNQTKDGVHYYADYGLHIGANVLRGLVQLNNTYFRNTDYNEIFPFFQNAAILNDSKTCKVLYNNLNYGYEDTPSELKRNLPYYKGPILFNSEKYKNKIIGNIKHEYTSDLLIFTCDSKKYLQKYKLTVIAEKTETGQLYGSIKNRGNTIFEFSLKNGVYDEENKAYIYQTEDLNLSFDYNEEYTFSVYVESKDFVNAYYELEINDFNGVPISDFSKRPKLLTEKQKGLECWEDGKLYVWNGEKWLYHQFSQYNTSGETSQRPQNIPIGFQYYDTTLKKYIVWNGTEWTNMDGTNLDTPTTNR